MRKICSRAVSEGKSTKKTSSKRPLRKSSGGIDSIDNEDDPLWFYAQVLNGPLAIVINIANQSLLGDLPPDVTDRFLQGDDEVLTMLQRKGLGRVNEMGTLFSALAGLMNLVVILDALQGPGGGRREEEPA